jgi:hypothetical protein
VTKNGKGVEGWEAVKEIPPKLKGKRKKEKKNKGEIKERTSKSGPQKPPPNWAVIKCRVTPQDRVLPELAQLLAITSYGPSSQ